MSFGQVAVGLASVVLGLHHLRNGAEKLRSSRSRHQMAALDGLELSLTRGNRRRQKPRRGMFHDSGRREVRLPSGQVVGARMRSYHIRTLNDRIKHLQARVNEEKRNPEVYAFARRATSKKCGNRWCIPEKDNLGEAKAIFQAIRGNVRYTSDIRGVDTYQNPTRTLGMNAGDCDDYTTLACAALESVGIPCRFKVIRTKGANDWNHIYAQAGFPRQKPKKWVSIDASVNKPFGWEAPPFMVAASRVFPVG